ncbi:sialidase family protein [Brachyspira aalborgi]|uniref:Exo-alpha-sialidase n=1 Tax=Brachyspira aalborgi TaxID=29522 RepID=A0A5C8EU95_9SPIR|nr:sialidase family protein [Brachyspira aalborgi]TXJ40521.1 exo-alpha-sialidase [Brachyspira aalborgi]
MRKRYFLITFAIITIIAGVWVLACKHPLGNGLTFPKAEENEEEVGIMDPDSTRSVVFNNTCIIPALTVTKDNTLIAAVGDKTTKGKILIKTSKDLGKTWISNNVEIKGDKITGFAHPFFINCHNGDILLGIATTNTGEDTVSFYRGSANATVWSKESPTIEKSTGPKNQANTALKPGNAFATYGNGIALRHGNNANKNTLLFPYYYKDTTKNSGVISTMISTNDGKHWEPYGNDEGPYASYGAKFIEIENGNILYFMNNQQGTAWFESTNCGKNSKCTTLFADEAHNEIAVMYADFVRYEFNGEDIIKSGSGKKYALMAYSSPGGTYGVKLTTDDFNNGQKGGSGKFYNQEVGTSSLSETYPSITVLKDGTICTLAAEEANEIVFKRFELKWLMNEY